MKIELLSKGIRLTEELRGHVERKLRAAVERFESRIREAHIRLTDINGPRGGDDVRCTLLVQLSPKGSLTIRETHRDAFSAVARASARAGRSLARHMERVHMRRRGRSR